ncbi:MAG: sulfurtransferase [Gammaproteobacteria bacterium]|nr:sulfurtransferase [Gammaproteobacteria bacterium]
MRNLSAVELKKHLEQADPTPLLLDVREPWEYQQVHFPSSDLIPMRQIPMALSKLDQQQEIVVICHHGIRSRQVAMFMENYGFKNIINLHGGIDAWAREIDSTMALY